jgi:hypothetical protein
MDYLILNDTFSIANVGSNINDDPILLSKKLNKLMLKYNHLLTTKQTHFKKSIF